MAKENKTVRALPKPHRGINICIVCGGSNPDCPIIVMPDKPPEPQFRNYAASAHLACFVKCKVLPTAEVN